MIKHNSEIINKLFFRELQLLIDKYNSIDEDIKNKIEITIADLKEKDLKSYLINNPDKIESIVKEEEVNNDLIVFFAWINMNVKEISIEVAKEYLEELKLNNYIQIEEYLIYVNDKYLNDYAREILEENLDSEYYIDKLFSKEDVIDMWINSMTKDEIIYEIINTQEIEEVLELHPQDAFTIEGIKYKYSEIEI